MIVYNLITIVNLLKLQYNKLKYCLIIRIKKKIKMTLIIIHIQYYVYQVNNSVINV